MKLISQEFSVVLCSLQQYSHSEDVETRGGDWSIHRQINEESVKYAYKHTKYNII